MKTIPDFISESAFQFPDACAIDSHEHKIGYRDFARHIHIAQSFFRANGIEPGQHIALHLPPCWQFPILFFALIKHGCVAVPINMRLPQEQRAACLKAAQISTILSDVKLSAAARIFDIADIFSHLPEATQPKANPISKTHPATLIFTSGSSGNAKMVVHSAANHYYSALGSNENILLQPGDRWLVNLPLHHVGALSIFFRTMLSGATAVFGQPNQEILNTLTADKITHVSLVATQLHRLLQHFEAAKILRSMKAILVGGGPLSPTLREQARDENLPILATYGSTEMSSQIATTPGGMPVDDTSGRLLPWRRMTFSDEGEILVGGETLCLGYFEEGRIISPTNREGWFATGDIGRIHKNGGLIVRGRRDNMFISGGENIHPEEIENALLKIDQIENALVTTISSEEFGERPVAFLQWAAGADLQESAVRQTLRTLIAGYKIPDHFFDWPQGQSSHAMKPSRPAFKRLAQRLTTS